MGILDKLKARTIGYKELVDWDWDMPLDVEDRAYLKRIALETTINFIARTFSQSEFWVRDNEKILQNMLSYKLNVRPNTDSSASDFWHKFIYKLVYDNEVLIIKTDTDDLVIADDFYREQYALLPDVFKSVVIKDYQYKRIFKMDEVIYINYNNGKLQKFVSSLFADYGLLFGQLMKAELRKNQIRALLRVKNAGGGMDEKRIQRIRKLGERLTKGFQNNDVSIQPEIDGVEYEELDSGKGASGNKSASMKLNDVKKLFIDDVAKIIGIPPSLIHGEMADLDNSMDAYLKFCINPLIAKVEDELNSKLFTEQEFMKGKRIEVIGINKRDPVQHAEAIDKLVASGVYTRNEVREMFASKRVEGLDKFVLTKNYEEDHTLKGGEKDDETKDDES
ncbi:phage portal protein [Staphylococcus xylosus]